MTAPLRVEDYLLAAPEVDVGLTLAEASAKFAAERSRLVKQQEKFDELCRLAEAQTTPDQLVAIAAQLSDFERQLATILVPVIRSAGKRIAKKLPAGTPAAQKSIYRLSEDAADIASIWLEAYQNAQIRLYRSASEKLKAAGHPNIEIRNAADLDKLFRENVE